MELGQSQRLSEILITFDKGILGVRGSSTAMALAINILLTSLLACGVLHYIAGLLYKLHARNMDAK